MIARHPLLDLIEEPIGQVYCREGVVLHHADVLRLYDEWESPVVIISDGAYGLNAFPDDAVKPEELVEW